MCLELTLFRECGFRSILCFIVLYRVRSFSCSFSLNCHRCFTCSMTVIVCLMGSSILTSMMLESLGMFSFWLNVIWRVIWGMVNSCYFDCFLNLRLIFLLIKNLLMKRSSFSCLSPISSPFMPPHKTLHIANSFSRPWKEISSCIHWVFMDFTKFIFPLNLELFVLSITVVSFIRPWICPFYLFIFFS